MYSAVVRSDPSSRPARWLATCARTLPRPAGSSAITTARPSNISQNRSLPIDVSIIPPWFAWSPAAVSSASGGPAIAGHVCLDRLEADGRP